MIQNYLKTTLRSLWKTRGYSLLNIVGLAIGIAAASLIFLWVDDELSYNKQFPNKENIYITKSKNGTDAVSGLMGPAMKEDIIGVKHAARVNWASSFLFQVGEQVMYQQGHIVDPEFMDIFSLQFVEGNRATALDKPNKIVITQSSAARLFGNKTAIGEQVRVNEVDSYVVAGVVEDLPENSTINFDWLISFEQFEKDNGWVRDWANSVIMTYVELEPMAKLSDVNHMLGDLVKRKSGNPEAASGHRLYPMERWRMYNSFDEDGNEQEGRIKYVRLFSIIAWVVLVIACINFMNMATARSEKRAKEVGIRKVVGASRSMLIRQFLGESLILAAISSIVAIVFIYLAIGGFNQLIEKNLSIDPTNLKQYLFLGGIVLVCGILSGIYPAFYLSSFNPISTLKGGLHQNMGAGFVRRGLVVIQYAASITLIVCTAVVYLQINHVKGRDMGYDMSQVIMVPLRGEGAKKIDPIRNQLNATGNIDRVGLSSGSPLHIGVRTSMNWAGKDPNKNVTLCYQWADQGYLATLGLTLLDGRDFRSGSLSDSSSIIINEAFAKQIRPDGKVVGQTLDWGGDPMTVIGVVNNFVYNNVYAPVEPVFFRAFDMNAGTLNIRTKSGINLQETIAEIEQIIKTNNPSYPFEYTFLDDQFNEIFQSERLIQKLAGIFGILSLVISCIGLIGLAAFSAERRRKEFGIRKVLGASTASVVSMISREFTYLVIVACLLAFPIAWWLMNDWLSNYEYRTYIHWWVFMLTAFAALAIALLAVGAQAIRAATVNPTKSLRNE